LLNLFTKLILFLFFQQLIRIYHVPDNTFSEDEAEDDDDEDGNDDN
jgi:hypothetical protein